MVRLGLRQRDRGQRRGWGVQGRKAVLSMGKLSLGWRGRGGGGEIYLLVNVSQCSSGPGVTVRSAEGEIVAIKLSGLRVISFFV